MPRPNRPRTIAGERSLARRIAHEREGRGWSYEGLAGRMTNVGCPINPSGLYKIEKADPPRRITVDELVAFAEVFKLPVDDLLLPPEVASRRDLVALMIDWDSARKAALAATGDESESWDRLKAYVDDHPEISKLVEEAFTIWAEFYSKPESVPLNVAERMLTLTGSPDWDQRLTDAVDERRQQGGRR